MQAPVQDFKCCVVKWSTSRRRFSSQLEALKTRILSERPDLVIVLDIPRHHAKKVGHQAWAQDYYVSKEGREITEKRQSQPSTPTPITVVYSRYPFYSEQWFLLSEDQPESGFAHITEVCLPLNAWHPDRSPLSLLQEYQLSYDEVSMLTFVIANHVDKAQIPHLKQTFAQEKVKNAVIYILPPDEATNAIPCGTSKASVEFQTHPPEHGGLWRVTEGGSRYSIGFASNLTAGDEVSGESEEEEH